MRRSELLAMAVERFRGRGHDDDLRKQFRSDAFHLSEHLESVECGQKQIEDDPVRAIGSHITQRRRAVKSARGFESTVMHQRDEKGVRRSVVFYYQDGAHWG